MLMTRVVQQIGQINSHDYQTRYRSILRGLQINCYSQVIRINISHNAISTLAGRQNKLHGEDREDMIISTQSFPMLAILSQPRVE
jgi:hypothetical protein